ncbi:hypothetical protein [Candidimonas nitroreducens]|uniref:Uncharacterized protein n=1 Tax=Candidimonas nitroreducens TaxID=683354 RepID=A0A225M1Q6_9BURK|nr:hypothetical protein [Candidimonas nitroreducens]OWT55248.1 hypothetical protein CEY11_21295 [Candidimonas nitroreducens]
MSKTIINISELNVFLSLGKAPSELDSLAVILHHAAEAAVDSQSDPETTRAAGDPEPSTGDTAGDAQASETPVEAAAPDVSVSQRVINALGSDERYTLRSFSGVETQLTDVSGERVSLALSGLMSSGDVFTKRRRGDRAALYGLTPAGHAKVTQPPVPAEPIPTDASDTISSDDILSFLHNGEYSKRTLSAIQKAFPNVASEVVAEAVDDMVADEDIRLTHRRRDGVCLYEAA